MADSFITPDGRVYSGPQAVDTFAAKVLSESLKLYEKTGLIPTRGVGLKAMLEQATRYTGAKYPASKKSIPIATASLDLLVAASTAALILDPPKPVAGA